MNKEDLLSDDFLKRFKSGEEFESFMKQLHRRGMEKLLEGELDAHLDYQKHKPRASTNSRNGYGTKQVVTDYGEDTIRVPRDREASFEPILVPKHTKFSTSFDFKVAKMIANERLTVYINNKLLNTNNVERNISESLSFPKIRLTWTAKKAELVEQIYAWDSAGCFNNGTTNIKELAEYIETVFNINLGDFYHTFLEIRERKGSRTLFLDKLIKLLEERMDGLDNK